MRVDDPNDEAKLALRDGNRLLEMGVVRNNHGHLAVVLESVEQQVGGEVDIGALLLGLDYLDGCGSAGPGLARRIRTGWLR
jgi:hypothetical protein